MLYHYADMESEPSVELTYEELRQVLPSFGFDVLHEEERDCPYTSNSRSMLQMIYHCKMFTCVKQRPSTVNVAAHTTDLLQLHSHHSHQPDRMRRH